MLGVVPALAWRSAASGALARIPRLDAYRGVMATSWGLALLGAAVLWWDGSLRPRDVGLRGLPPAPAAAWIAATLVALLAGAALTGLVRRLTGRPESHHLMRLVPRTQAERRLFPLVALTAGITEEFVFRGIALTALASLPLLDGSGGRWWAAAAVAAAFGLGHGYQDALGMARAAALGMVLAVPALLTGSLLPGMAAHAALDLCLLWGTGRRLAGAAP